MGGFKNIRLDACVAQGLTRGEVDAQSQAYRILAPTVMGMAVRILQDHALAEEVVQDTFVSLIERAETLRNADAVVAWVRQTAVNHCLMRLRSPWRQRRVDVALTDPSDDSRAATRDGNLRDLEQALALLGPETRMVLWLHEVEGYTHQEIGALVGKTSSFSKSQLSRGYQKLLEVYGGDRDDGIAKAANVKSACAT